MVFSLKHFSLIIVLLLLSACGGSGSGSVKKDPPPRKIVYADAVVAYKEKAGKLNQAKLTKDNSMAFIQAMVAGNVNKDIDTYSSETKSGLSGLQAQKSIKEVGKKSLSGQMNTRFRSSIKIKTKSCVGGGR